MVHFSTKILFNCFFFKINFCRPPLLAFYQTQPFRNVIKTAIVNKQTTEYGQIYLIKDNYTMKPQFYFFYFYLSFFKTPLPTNSNVFFNFHNISYINFLINFGTNTRFLNFNLSVIFKKFFNLFNLVFILYKYNYKFHLISSEFFKMESFIINKRFCFNTLMISNQVFNEIFLKSKKFSSFLSFLSKKLNKLINFFFILTDFVNFSNILSFLKKSKSPTFALAPISMSP